MAGITLVNPDRIQWACDEHGVSPRALADKLRITPEKLANVLSRDDALTFRQLRMIADFFGLGVLFFLEKGRPTAESAASPQYRTITNQKPELTLGVKKLVARVEQQRRIFVELSEDSDAAVQFSPPSDLPSSPRQTSTAARDWLGISDRDRQSFESYRRAVEDRGVLVLVSTGYKGKWRVDPADPTCGFALYHSETPVIFVVKQHEPRQSFTLMHELGHLLLHRDSFIDSYDDLESTKAREGEANAFAGDVLVTDTMLDLISLADKPSNVKDYPSWLQPYRDQWCVSADVIILRMIRRGMLDAVDYDRFKSIPRPATAKTDAKIPRKYRFREPRKLFGDRFVRTVLNALNEEEITLDRASRYLDGLSVQDLRKLEDHCARL
jgi:Zn-dependent peptidase ImmA (M78 family)